MGGDNWRLELREANVQDSGVYCCHVSTHPPLLKHVKLTVFRKYNESSGKMYLLTYNCYAFLTHRYENAVRYLQFLIEIKSDIFLQPPK